MRIALIDLQFSWPLSGGAGRDLVETFTRIRQNHEVRLFRPLRPGEKDEWERVPLPVEGIRCSEWTPSVVSIRLLDRITTWQPDVLFFGDGWAMKARLVPFFTKFFPTVLRLYSYEMLCPRNNELWQHTHACEFPTVHDWTRCIACAKQYREAVLSAKGKENPLTDEMNAATIWDGTFSRDAQTAISQSSRVIVYNKMLADFLFHRCGRKCDVVPGGVDQRLYKEVSPYHSPHGGEPFRLLSFGRMNDPAKGADDVISACRILLQTGERIVLVVTREKRQDESWLKETGWLDQDGLVKELSSCHAVIVPSRWQEAFGMTWLEAMAADRPVITTRVAGPLDHLEDGKHALLISPGDSNGLAEAILRLKSDKALVDRLRESGKQLAAKLSWDFAAKLTENIISEVTSKTLGRFLRKKGEGG